MPDFSHHEKAEVAPWVCATCGTHQGPFLALNIETAQAPNVVCEPCCVLIGREVGTSDPGVAEELQGQVTTLSQQLIVTQQDLAESRTQVMKVVSLEEALAEAKAKSDVIAEPPPKPKPEPKEEPKATATATEERPLKTAPKRTPPAQKQGGRSGSGSGSGSQRKK